MRINKWTLGLAAAGLVTLPTAVRADEQQTHPLGIAVQSTTLSGYVNVSAHWNPGSHNTNNPAYSFGGRNKADGFNLDAVNLTIEKPLDEAAWAAGYKVDLLFGPDANALATASSLMPDGDLAVKQAYVALRAPVGNGLDAKFGVFDTVIGYEAVHAGNNPNYTRSYGFTIEPTTHTGLLLAYQFCEWFSASAGLANTFGPAINQRAFGNAGNGGNDKSESYKTYMGAIAVTAPNDWGWIGGSTLYAGVINGFNNTALGSDRDADADNDGAVQTSYYAGATLNTPIEALKVGAAFDYLFIDDQTLQGVMFDGGSAWALAGYVSFQATEKLSLHGRADYFSQPVSWAGGGLPDKVFAATGTVQYDLWANVTSRLEFRWDHAAGEVGNAYGVNSAGEPDLKNAYLLALNVIYKF